MTTLLAGVCKTATCHRSERRKIAGPGGSGGGPWGCQGWPSALGLLGDLT